MLKALYSHRLVGAILLVAGCCIGAGMLGLPLVTVSAGFLPTVATFFVSWLFMLSTGLLLLEVNLWFGRGINLMTLAENTLGKMAKYIVAFLFVFLFYCLMVAYIAGGGALIQDYIHQLLGHAIDPFWGSLALVVIFGVIIFFGTSKVDLANRFLMAGLGVSYVGLILLGLPHVVVEHLEKGAWMYAFPALPTMIISFGYHNLVPSLTDYLEGNARGLRLAIAIGSAIPLAIYLLWDTMILGIIPPGAEVQAAIDKGAMVTTLLRNAVSNSYVVHLMHAFAFFALVTSLLTVALSFVDFLADGMHVKKTRKGALLLVSLVLLPPLVFAYLYPAIFLSSLNYAGAFGAVILFGIFPVLMVWKGRYIDKRIGKHQVPGGKWVLCLIGAFAFLVFALQLKNELGV